MRQTPALIIPCQRTAGEPLNVLLSPNFKPQVGKCPPKGPLSLLRESGLRGPLKGDPPPGPLWGKQSLSTSIQPRQRTKMAFLHKQRGGWGSGETPPHPKQQATTMYHNPRGRTGRFTCRVRKAGTERHREARDRRRRCERNTKRLARGRGGNQAQMGLGAPRSAFFPPTMLGSQLTGTPPAPAPLAVT